MNRDENLWERTPFDHKDLDEGMVPSRFPQSATHLHTNGGGAWALWPRARLLIVWREGQARTADKCRPAVEREEAAGWMHVNAT